MDRPTAVGMAWYRREDYARLLDLMADRNRLPDTYEAWRVSAEQVEGTVAGSGVAVIRVPLDPDIFAAWCRKHDLVANAAARSRYAADGVEKAKQANP